MNPERDSQSNLNDYFYKLMITYIIKINLYDTEMPKEHFLSRTG